MPYFDNDITPERLREMQEYYDYRGPETWFHHEPPPIDPRVNEILAELGGKCPAGDARYKLNWGGTATKENIVHRKNGTYGRGLTRKYPFAPIKKFLHYEYFDGVTHVTTTNKDLIPQNYIARPIYEVDVLGRMRWFFEEKKTLDELVADGEFPHPDSYEAKNEFGYRDGKPFCLIPDRRGEYVCQYPLETQDDERLYVHPTFNWVCEVVAIVKNSLNQTKQEMFAEDWAKQEKAEKLIAEREMEYGAGLIEENIIRTEREGQGKIYFT